MARTDEMREPHPSGDPGNDDTNIGRAQAEAGEDLPLLLAQAHREVHTRLGRILDADNLPVEQWRILETLSDGEGLTMSALAERVSMNISALSKTIDRMVSRALVHRRQDPQDQRRVHVYISDFGLETLSRRAPDVADYRAELVRRLGADQVDDFIRMLREIAAPASVN